MPRGFYNTGDFDKGILDSAFMEHLRVLATRFKATATRPFKVNDIYRSPVHNLRHSGDQSTGGASSGAAKNSLHQYGCAADLQTFPFPRNTPDLTAQAIKYWGDLAGAAAKDRNLWIEPRVKKQGSAFASTESHVHVSYCPGVVR